MLLSLSIRHFVIVDTLELDFCSGFTVLTGETGAGKSIILDALGLLLGGRGDGSLVRHGEERAELAATFDLQALPELARQLADDALVEAGDTELLIRRVIDASGRSRCWLNGRSATLAQLKDIGEALVDIHGQHAHQSLNKPDTQRRLLDAYAGAVGLATEVRSCFDTWQTVKHQRQEAERHAAEFERERERLVWQISELAELQLAPDEWEQLTAQHSRLAHAQELTEAAHSAVELINEADGAILSQLAQVQSRLGKLADVDPQLKDTVGLLDSVEAELREVVYALRDYGGDIEQDPAELYRVENRIDTLYSMARKFRVRPEELPEKLAGWQAELARLSESTDIDALIEAETRAERAYCEVAEQLSLARQHAAIELSGRISDEMQNLAMQGARFAIELAPLAAPAASGMESVEYLVAANAGTTLRPLSKVASGGELSRISLAFQVVASEVARVPTLIFDEVDVGIGGRVAEVVGRLLRRLGERYQVLCITHLPQVAACGNSHWQVAKRLDGGRTVSSIQPLSEAERVEEVARMLGGEQITDTTRQHAAELLTLAH
ncbi:RecN [Laribacter hongkongensis HLHK9]|uniref:DNA repair protein RecN n=1 Tax=Laribacter hongkongensis (strain HLHK9) TaxID=557598 RepID=C1D6U4_LARHH|nr:DNA repair protein RecN [Laribacter hongkongensis]ACO74201.1 RecN [Laribacter hongkongensis HLHK9]